MKRKQIYIDPEQEREVKWLAARRGTSEAFVIREAVARYVADEREREVEAPPGQDRPPSSAELQANPLLGVLGIADPGLPADGSVAHDAALYGRPTPGLRRRAGPRGRQ